jgi:glycosyltransferase involved in cell wall biosynthesis
MGDGDLMKKILVRGPLLSNSGYGNHARQVFDWVLKTHPDCEIQVQVLPWGSTSWKVNPELDNGMIGEIMRRTGNITGKFDVSFQIQLPNEWDPNLAHKNIGITALVESDKCNPLWIDCCNKMSEIVVPSSFVKQTIENTGKVNVPIHVIPESFMGQILSENCRDIGINLETAFNFLIVGTITGNNPYNDRKNIFFTVKWLCEEFANDPDVGIVIKANAGRGTKFDWPQVTDIFKKVISEVRKGPYPRIHLLNGMVEEDELVSLYRNPGIKAIVSATRGEGYGLPLLEAAACDLPVIATGFSGHTDFLGKGKYLKLDYQMTEIHETRVDGNIWIKGTKWAEVSEEDFKKKIRKFKSSSDIPRQWAAELGKTIREQYSPESVTMIYEKTLGHLF